MYRLIESRPINLPCRLRWVALAFALLAALSTSAWSADEADAHTAPVAVRIFFRDGTIRQTSLIAQAKTLDAKPTPQMRFLTPTGEIELWMDTLVTISEVTDRPNPAQASALFRIGHSPARRLAFGETGAAVVVENGDGTREIVDLRKIARLQVVQKPTAVASAGN